MTTGKTDSQTRRGFSLLELLFTVAIIAILATLLLPVIQNAQRKAQRTRCTNNLKQIGTAFHLWAHDHQDRFPMAVPMSERGTLEFAQPGVSMVAFKHFQALSNELVEARLLVCPADKGRVAALSFADLQNSNVSYLVNTRAVFGKTESVLAGDRNIRTSGRMDYTFLQFGPGDVVEWSSALHGALGNVLFSDAHIDLVLTANASHQLTNAGEVLAALPQPDLPAAAVASVQNEPPLSSASTPEAAPSPLTANPPTANPSSQPQSTPATGDVAKPITRRPGEPDLAPPANSPSSVAANASPDPRQGSGATAPIASPLPGNDIPNAASNRIPNFADGERNATVRSLAASNVSEMPPAAIAATSAPTRTVITNTVTSLASSNATAAEPERENKVIGFARGLGSRFSYSLLLVLLAILVAIEIIRRRRNKKQGR